MRVFRRFAGRASAAGPPGPASRRVESVLGITALGVFAIQFAALDALCLAASPARLPAWAASALFWGGLAVTARTRATRAAVSVLASSLVVVQAIFYWHYHGFFDLDAAACARHMWSDVAPVLWQLLPLTLLATVVVAVVEAFLLHAAPVLPRRNGYAALALGGALTLGVGRLTTPAPDASAIGALRVLVRPAEALAAGHVRLPPLPASRARVPNVLFVLTESVRASDYCAVPSEPCAIAPETAALLPRRVALTQLRSLGSYTAIAVNALLAGRMPLGSREEIAGTPLVFDYLRAVRSDGARPRVAYWSAQTDSLFERSDVRDATDSFSTLDDLVGHPVGGVEEVLDQHADALLASRVEQKLPELRAPLFLMLHLSGTHAPYFVDEARAPYAPYVRSASWAGLDRLHNAYKNAILAQDQSVARMLRAFLQRVGDEPWLVFFTSDHGEAFGEHKAIHHGQNTYDEQIHVPGFVAFGNGALDARQEAALRSHRDDFVTHLDVLPTLLDALGVLDAFALSAQRPRWPGRSWLRPFPANAPPLPVTNCTPLFPCPLKNWGVLGDGHALVAQAWDADFRCVDLRTGEEGIDPKSPECAELRRASRTWWANLPSGRENR